MSQPLAFLASRPDRYILLRPSTRITVSAIVPHSNGVGELPFGRPEIVEPAHEKDHGDKGGDG